MGGKCRVWWRLICKLVVHLYLCLAACFFSHCGEYHEHARRAAAHDVLVRASTHNSGEIGPPNPPKAKNMNGLMEILVDMVRPLDESSSNTQPYGKGVSSPFSLPPYDSLAPIPLLENTPPFCVNPPPFTPQLPPPSPTTLPMQPPPTPPSSSYSPSFPFPNPSPPPSPVGTAVPSPPESSIYPTPPSTPSIAVPSPPESSIYPTPPLTPETPSIAAPSPPETYVPSPSVFVPSPPPPSAPYYSPPSPPIGYVPNPPGSAGGGGGGGFVPPSSPRVYQPPNVYPSPLVPPPSPLTEPASALWCVAKPSVPGPIIQEAMNYACASGAECDQIQPSGSCFEPDTLVAHASYAFNSYWQRTKVAGGTCEFGGTAMLVTVDPSYDGCHFIYF
nr:leucine-rich repeat extensin-like protein 5 isoform X1 [Coffea arabica]